MAALNLIIALLLPTAVWAEDPETKVTISIYDLVQMQKGGPKLPADYGKQVAATIAREKQRLLDCLRNIDNFSEDLQLELAIAATGKADLEPFANPNPASTCIAKLITSLSYPKHPLKKAVAVTIPLKLARGTR